MTIDLDELRGAIRGMRRGQPLYKVLKDELGRRGYWKNLPRGNPARGYEVSKAGIKRGLMP